jgi:hypothetical protein
MIVMHVVMTQIGTCIVGAALLGAQADRSRQYALPVRTSTIVTWRLLPAMAVVALQSALITTTINAVSHMGWPVCGPALFMAVAFAAICAVLWLTETSGWMLIGVACVAAVLGCWHKSRYGPAFSQPTHMWREVTPVDAATLLAVAALAWWAAVVGVARTRRGDPLPPLGISAWLERVFDAAPGEGLAFRSPLHAHAWYEWQRKGWAMPGCFLFCAVGGVGAWMLFNRDPQELFAGFIAGGGLLTLLGALGGAVMGNCGPHDGNYELGQFLATRPMTTTDMANTVLTTAARSVVVTWAIWAAAFLLVYLVLLATHVSPRPELPQEIGWWYFPATLLGPWIVVAMGATIGLTGRLLLFLQLLVGLLALWFAWLVFAGYLLSYETRLQLTHTAMALCGAALVLGTAWAFAAARRRSLIGSPAVSAAASVWALLSGCVVFDWLLHRTASLPFSALVIGLCALVVAPCAGAPLALAWNRNR